MTKKKRKIGVGLRRLSLMSRQDALFELSTREREINPVPYEQYLSKHVNKHFCTSKDYLVFSTHFLLPKHL